MRKIDDRIILGIVVGLIANIPKTLSNEYLYRKGIEKRRFGDIVAGIFLPRFHARSKEGTIFGFFGEMFVSCFLGIPLVYLLTYTGKDKAAIKGWVTALFGFGLFRGIIATLGIGQTYPRDVKTNAVMSMTSSLWGIVAGTVTALIGHPDLFKPRPHIQSNPSYVTVNNNKSYAPLLEKDGYIDLGEV